ncbi:flavin-binding monooxygenase [Fusarium coicis]|nr:flavin-binding monooxygenase [Fusarium coicis]
MGSRGISQVEGVPAEPLQQDWIRPNPNYKIPNITLKDPANKRLRVITIGGGMSGICMAYKIQEQMQNVEHQVYERNADIGGTWYENRYPGCDVPSHAYTFPWAPNPDWPRFLAHSDDIRAYVHKVVDKFGLGKYFKVNHQVAGCWWDAERAKWKVKVEIVKPKLDWSSTAPLEVIDSFWDECDFLQHATGILNRWDLPKIKGISRFRGRLVHTAGWPDDFWENEWKSKRIAVIGSGASSVQTVPTMQLVDNVGNNYECEFHSEEAMEPFADQAPNLDSEEEKRDFRAHPEKLVEHIKSVEKAFNSRWNHNLMGTPEQLAMKEAVRNRMRSLIKEDKIFEKMTPDFPVNCRRLVVVTLMTPGDPYMKAIQEDNVEVRFTSVDEITEDGVIGGDGVEHKVDAIVCATGFDCTHRPRFPVVGRNGVDLREKWKDFAEGYFGVACPDMPNWVTFLGPNWPVAAGSIMAALDANGEYAIMLMRKLQDELVKSICPSQKATDEFNEHTQTWGVGTVWGQPCRSWYICISSFTSIS